MPMGMYKRTKYHRERLSSGQLHRDKFTKEHKLKMSKSHIGHITTNKTKKKIGIANTKHGQYYTPWGKMWIRCRSRVKYNKYYIEKKLKCRLTWVEVKRLWKRDKADKMIKPCIHRINNNIGYIYSNCEIIEHIAHATLHAYKKGE